MALYTTYNDVGIKESVSDVISNLSPTETPFISGIGTDKVGNVLCSWLEDSLDAVAVNAQVEGASVTTYTLNPPVLRTNATQIFSKNIQISGTDDAVQLHGRDNQFAYQMAKQAKAVKRDLEYACVGTAQNLVNTNAATARQFNGVQAQIPSGGLVKTGATGTAMTEGNLLTALEYCYNNGADPDTALLTPDDAITIAGYAQTAGRYRTYVNDQKQVTNVVNIYASPFGDVKVVIDRFLKPGDSLVYDKDMWKLLVLRNWHTKELAENGDFSASMLIGEFSLKHANQAASAIIRRTA